jgi:hypothetical protein
MATTLNPNCFGKDDKQIPPSQNCKYLKTDCAAFGDADMMQGSVVHTSTPARFPLAIPPLP